jgi:hypothetical protein
MPYNLRASQADRLNSPTGRFVSISSEALFFDFLANPPPILDYAFQTQFDDVREE